MLPSCHRCSGLSALFQGPAERWRQQRSPSDGRMVVLRQFGLLLWKNYILQVGWHCALTGLPPSPLHVETAELAQSLDSPANLHQGPGASPGEKQICLCVWGHPAFVLRCPCVLMCRLCHSPPLQSSWESSSPFSWGRIIHVLSCATVGFLSCLVTWPPPEVPIAAQLL